MTKCAFIRCTLNNCTLFYSGGDADFTECELTNCQFHFRGPAENTFKFFKEMGMLKTKPVEPDKKVTVN